MPAPIWHLNADLAIHGGILVLLANKIAPNAILLVLIFANFTPMLCIYYLGLVT